MTTKPTPSPSHVLHEVPAANPAARGAAAFVSARRHSTRVRVLKILLPMLALLIAFGFVGYSWLSTPGNLSVEVSGTAVRDGKLVMALPKLDGFTKDNQPYSMSAARAIQDFDKTNVIYLEDINAELPMGGDTRARITAPSGIYDREKNTLEIDSEVSVKTNDGMAAQFQSAFLDLQAGTMKTGEPVDIDLDGSHIAAQSMAVTDHGKVLHFNQGVRVRIDPAEAGVTEKVAGGTDAKK